MRWVRLRRDGIASGSTVEADGGQVGGRGAPRPSAMGSDRAMGISTPGSNPAWATKAMDNRVC